MNYYRVVYLLAICFTSAFAIYQVKLVKNSPNSVLGQGPFWDRISKSLYYVDIERPSVVRYDYRTNKVYEAKLDGVQLIGFIVSVANSKNQFVAGLDNRAVVIEWDGKSSNVTKIRTLFEVATGTEQVFNEAKADQRNRLFAGTIRDLDCDYKPEVANASLYRYSKEDGVTDLFDNVYISNGLEWDTRKNIFYYIGACELHVKAYHYNPRNGEISNGRVAVDFRVKGKYPGFIPTGMTIDRDGFLWVTAYGAYRILKINPCTGRIVQTIKMPVRSVIGCAFGGPNMDVLFVVTGQNKTDIRYGTDVIGNNPMSQYGGQLFTITGLGSRGYYPNAAKV